MCKMWRMSWLKNKVRTWYERQINLDHGRLMFLGNVATLQLGPEEYIDINPCSKHIVSSIRITATGARPVLAFTHWPKGMEWREEMPIVRVIIEEKRTLIRLASTPCEADSPTDAKAGWFVPQPNDPILPLLNDLFHAFAFYQPLRAEHKRKFDAKAEEKILE